MPHDLKMFSNWKFGTRWLGKKKKMMTADKCGQNHFIFHFV